MADLLGYQQLIINSSQHCQEGCWVVYDRHFRLKASATGCKDWAPIDINIWKIASLEQTLAAAPLKALRQPGSGVPVYSSKQPPNKHRNIYLDWNNDSSPTQVADMNTIATSVFLILQPWTTNIRQCSVLINERKRHYSNNPLLAINQSPTG